MLNAGTRCLGPTLVILGNGPSLKGFDFSRLKDFDCIGMNAAYRYWHEIGWYPRYYICLDLVVGLSHKDAIVNLIRSRDRNGIEVFFLRRNLIVELPTDLLGSPYIVDFDILHKRKLQSLAAGLITTGSHAALVGAYLGYRTLVLLGVDCSYQEMVEGAYPAGGRVLEMIRTPSDNPNYFFSGYQVAGDKYHQPNPFPGLHLRSWRAIAGLLKSRGITVWNCSSLSHLDVFHFCQFELVEAGRLQNGEHPRTLQVAPRLFSAGAEGEEKTARWRDFLPELTKRWVARLYRHAPEAVKAFGRRWSQLGKFATWPVTMLWGRQRAHERASIAFSKATLVATELKALEEKINRLTSKDSMPK